MSAFGSDMTAQTLTAEDSSGFGLDEEPLVVAALAAALAEYQRCLGQYRVHGRQEGAGSNWRALTRWEQLRGRM